MVNYGHVHNGHAYATLTRPFFKILKKQIPLDFFPCVLTTFKLLILMKNF